MILEFVVDNIIEAAVFQADQFGLQIRATNLCHISHIHFKCLTAVHAQKRISSGAGGHLHGNRALVGSHNAPGKHIMRTDGGNENISRIRLNNGAACRKIVGSRACGVETIRPSPPKSIA